MGRKNSTTWAAGNPITAARLQNFNQDLDDLYQYGVDRMRIYRLTTDPALQVTIGGGVWRVGDQEGTYAGGTVTVGATATTYIMIDNTGAIQTSTSAWNPNYARIGTVVAAGGVITSITINKIDAIGGLLSWKGIPDMRNTPFFTPIQYATQTQVWPEFRPQSSWFGTWYVWVPGMDGIVIWWTVVTYWNWTGTGGGVYVTQIAYSNNTANWKNYIFFRQGASDSTWGSWERVSSFANNLNFWTRIQLNGVPTASTLLSLGGFVSATATLVNYTASTGTGNVDIQTSPDNSTWTTVASGRADGYYQTNGQYPWTPSVSTFIAPGLYVRATWSAATNIVNVNICITPFA